MSYFFERFLHGGDYNPEQWLDSPEILEQDIEYFKKAHINEVSMGIFSWSVLEPEEGVFCFEWMEQIIDRLYENGISVILATPSGARPKWMTDKYPEVLRVDDRRNRALFGGRHNHCYSSPVYREKTREMNTRLAKKFGPHPGVIAWHISNEYNGECHCELCQKEFRSWLKERYGTIGKVNKAWTTTFWSHIYTDFEQIESPSGIGEMSVHGLNLDWKRFVTDRTVDFARHEIQALRDGGSDKPVTTNLMYDFSPLNYHRFADIVDFVSWDNYPAWHKKPEYITAGDAAMQHDIMRSLMKQPFLLMESCPSATNWQPVSKLKKPGMLELASMQAVAHGSDSVQYFQLRQSRGSAEKFHGAVIDHYGGDDTRVFREVTGVGATLAYITEVIGSCNVPEVAVLFDWESRWAMENSQGPRNCGLFYKETVQKAYLGFRKLGMDVDLIDMTQELDGYRIVVCPMLYMFREGFEKKLRSYVENGGIVLMTYWSGIADETDLCFLGGTPHDLMDVFGLRSTEIDGLYDWETNAMVPAKGNALGMEKEWTCSRLCELVEVSDAEILAVYKDDFYAGTPAFTRKAYGKGQAFYICADFEQGFYDEVLEKLSAQAGVERVLENIPQGIEVTVRKKEGTNYVFLQNFNPVETEIRLPEGFGTVISGAFDGRMKGFSTVIFRQDAADKEYN